MGRCNMVVRAISLPPPAAYIKSLMYRPAVPVIRPIRIRDYLYLSWSMRQLPCKGTENDEYLQSV